jgi:hypothetical protein
MDVAICIIEVEVDWVRLDRCCRLPPTRCMEALISDIELEVSSTDLASSMTLADTA